MTATSDWLGDVGIENIHVADGDNMHDGFVELHIGVTLSINGTSKLEKFLTAKVKDVMDIFVQDTTIRVSAKRRKGEQLDATELREVASKTIQAMKAWAAQQDGGDLTFIISHHSRERELEAMATNSTKQSYGAGENSSFTY